MNIRKYAILEPTAVQVCVENAKPPLIFQLPPEQGRAALDAAQASPVPMWPARIDSYHADTGPWGRLPGMSSPRRRPSPRRGCKR